MCGKLKGKSSGEGASGNVGENYQVLAKKKPTVLMQHFHLSASLAEKKPLRCGTV